MTSSCPVAGDARKKGCSSENLPPTCPVSGDVLSPLNMMPTTLAASAASASSAISLPLSDVRVTSSISRTDGEESWKYPSPAMFYAAVERKGHQHAVDRFQAHPEDVEAVVTLHNIVNEQVWVEILKYESLHVNDAFEKMEGKSSGPTLTRFIGRPNDLSPKARFLHLIG